MTTNRPPILHTPNPCFDGLPNDERDALIELLRDTIAVDRFPLSPRIRRLKAILAKLDPVERLAAVPLPPPKPPGERSMTLRRKRRR